MLVAVECDALTGYGGAFEKVGHRRSLVISLVCLAVAIKLGYKLSSLLFFKIFPRTTKSLEKWHTPPAG